MRTFAFALGWFVALATLVALVADLWRHLGDEGGPDEEVPPAFRQELREVGPLEIAFRGHVTLVTDQRSAEDATGRVARVPRYRLEGDDPVPEGAGMRLKNVRIVALEADEPMTAEAPSAWIPLSRNRGLLVLDLGRAWKLEGPHLRLPGVMPGRSLEAWVDGRVLLWPEEDRLEGRGSFRIRADAFELVAGRLAYDVATRTATFAPWQGGLRWSLDEGEGRRLVGRSGAGGRMTPHADGWRLELEEGGEGIRLRDVAPEGETWLAAHRLALDFLPVEGGGWRPLAARLDGPVQVAAADAAFSGGDAEARWDANGALTGLALAGPCATTPWTPPLQLVTCRRGLDWEPHTGVVNFRGPVRARDDLGFAAADGGRLDGDALALGGEVLLGHGGFVVRADRLEAALDGGWRLAGDVVVEAPPTGPVRRLLAPSLTGSGDGGELAAPDGFRIEGESGGEPFALSGDALTRSRERGEDRLLAEGDLRLVWRDARLAADRLVQSGPERYLLEGSPVRLEQTLADGGVAVADFPRAFLHPDRLEVVGRSRFLAPARSFGLAGEAVELRADHVVRSADDGVWLLERDLVVTGAAEGEADRLRFLPGEWLRLERDRGAPRLAATLDDGRRVDLTGREVEAREGGVLELRGAAAVVLAEPDGGGVRRLAGDLLHLERGGGEAEGAVSFAAPEGEGEADRARWRTTAAGDGKGGLTWLRLEGSARLVRPDLTAEGAVLELDLERGTVFVSGGDGVPAHLLLADGRDVRADWLRYNLRTRLLETGPIQVESPQESSSGP